MSVCSRLPTTVSVDFYDCLLFFSNHLLVLLKGHKSTSIEDENLIHLCKGLKFR